MYPYIGQPVDDAPPPDDNGQSSSWAASPELDYQPHRASQSQSESTSSTSTDIFFDDPFIDSSLRARNPSRYDPVLTPGANEVPSSSTTFVDDPFRFTLDPRADLYHPMYNPYPIPYQGSGPLGDPFPPRYSPIFPLPIVSVDGTSTLAPNSEDIIPLGVPQPLDEPLPLGDSFPLRDSLDDRAPSPPPPPPRTSGSRRHQPPEKPLEFKFWPYPQTRPKLRGIASTQGFSDAAPSTEPLRPSRIAPLQYNDNNQIHQSIFEQACTTLIRSALGSCPFLSEQERKAAAREALELAANAHDNVYGNQWSSANLIAFYKSFTAPPSADIMSTCKKTARAVVQIGYELRPAIWSEDSKPQYQIDKVKDLIDNPSFPLKFIFGNDSADPQDDEVYPFEHRVISTVVLNTVLKLSFVPFVTELDDLFCSAAAAVECVLQELASAKKAVSIDFGVANFKPRFTLLKEYIRIHIKTNARLSTRWEAYKNRIRARLLDIVAAY
ncbi:hypothetical protein EDD22DRAFT_963309 [Suillus occidentalis]|nr:hypothetical protein EDD22DRAFT_963309 [Suillus occidentalis]